MSKQDGIGTWVWNEVVNLEGELPLYEDFEFVSNGLRYINIAFSSFDPLTSYLTIDYEASPNDSHNAVVAYSPIAYDDTGDGGDLVLSKGWQNQAYRTIDIKTAPPAEFLTILQANATYQGGAEPAPSGTAITYNGAAIATLSEGQTGTLACAGKKAVTDIAVVFAAAGKVTYNGKETAVEAGKTATLSCAGKKMVTDVVIAVGGGQAPVDDELLGTWVFNEILSMADPTQDYIMATLSFASGGTDWVGLDFGFDSLSYYTSIDERPKNVWDSLGGWADQYQTITITDTSALTNRDEFTAWLKANATKQS